MLYTSIQPLLVFILLCCPPSAHAATLKLFFTYQSWQNTPDQWFTMFTLCLAPLATHIAFGLAKQVTLGDEKPPWTEKITQFNPVSIMWRYYAIPYRRLRAIRWDAADMAACNAAFWDGSRWDGSEYMMIRSREHFTNLPDSNHIALISGSALACITLSLQGVQAIFIVIGSIFRPNSIGFSDGIPFFFMPLGLLGLLRLPAAYWITKDFGFSGTRGPFTDFTRLTQSELEVWKFAVRCRMSETRNWKCLCYRIWWVASISTIMGFGVCDIIETFNIPGATTFFFSTSNFLFQLLYLLLTTGCILIHFIYVWRREHVSTLIPCIQSQWYKLYTYVLMATAAVTLIVGSLETIQVPDGTYTTWPPSNCSSVNGICTPVNRTLFMTFVDEQWGQFLDKNGVS
jgi:hypothetical protein